jgi:hypothetical protein
LEVAPAVDRAPEAREGQEQAGAEARIAAGVCGMPVNRRAAAPALVVEAVQAAWEPVEWAEAAPEAEEAWALAVRELAVEVGSAGVVEQAQARAAAAGLEEVAAAERDQE